LKPVQIEQLSVTEIQVPPIRITSHMDDELQHDFELSVQTAGILQPLHVMRSEGTLWLIDGLHRLQQAKARGGATVPCVVVEGSYRDAVLQNLATSWLHGRPKNSELRQVIKHLFEELGMDVLEIRQRLGISQTTIENLIWVNRAIAKVQEALDADQMPLGAAVAIARIGHDHYQQRMYEVYMVHRPNVEVFAGACADVRASVEAGDVPMTPTEIHGEPQRRSLAVATCEVCERPSRRLVPLMLCPSCYAAAEAAAFAHDSAIAP
jgi:ParB-like chromosome segregation protein Spo0J